jgi:ribosomal protein S18 acetylase RimI-like enzyme
MSAAERIPAPEFCVRAAQPADIPALMRLKLQLAEAENGTHAVRATAAEWERDGFGPDAGFTAFVAESCGAVVGMATCSKRLITGWNTPVVFLQDLFVDQHCRGQGVASLLLAQVAALARQLGSPIVELTVLAENTAAKDFYRRSGFLALPQCLTYVLAGPALAALAEQGMEVEF